MTILSRAAGEFAAGKFVNYLSSFEDAAVEKLGCCCVDGLCPWLGEGGVVRAVAVIDQSQSYSQITFSFKTLWCL